LLFTLKNQTYSKIEIIIVDFSCCDNVALIAKKYNAKVIKRKKQFVNYNSIGLLTGTKKAKGEFLMFIDQNSFPSDLQWIENHYNKLIMKKLEMVDCPALPSLESNTKNQSDQSKQFAEESGLSFMTKYETFSNVLFSKDKEIKAQFKSELMSQNLEFGTTNKTVIFSDFCDNIDFTTNPNKKNIETKSSNVKNILFLTDNSLMINNKESQLTNNTMRLFESVHWNVSTIRISKKGLSQNRIKNEIKNGKHDVVNITLSNNTLPFINELIEAKIPYTINLFDHCAICENKNLINEKGIHCFGPMHFINCENNCPSKNRLEIKNKINDYKKALSYSKFIFILNKEIKDRLTEHQPDLSIKIKIISTKNRRLKKTFQQNDEQEAYQYLKAYQKILKTNIPDYEKIR
jgi:glycosyltransferase involved in cell wall biosynthesis